MKQLKIPWDEGEGNIVASYKGRGNGPVIFTTDGPNEGIDREQSLTFETTEGPNKEIVNVLVKQKGKREHFLVEGEGFYLPDGSMFDTLKN